MNIIRLTTGSSLEYPRYKTKILITIFIFHMKIKFKKRRRYIGEYVRLLIRENSLYAAYLFN